MNVDFSRLLGRPEIRLPNDALSDAIRGRPILVTGAAGSVGTALSHLLGSQQANRLVLLDNHEPSLFHLLRSFPADLKDRVRPVLADARDRRKLQRIFSEERPQIIFHLAAYKQVPLAEQNIDQVIDVNVGGFLNVAELAAQYDSETVVYPSTDKAVQSSSIYGATKRVIELLCRSFEYSRPRLMAVRLVNVFGTQGSVVEVFARQIAAGQPITLTSAEATRYWITMDEALHLLIAATIIGAPATPLVLDMGKPISMAETARRLIETLAGGRSVEIEVTGLRAGERLHEMLTYPYERLENTKFPGFLRVVDERPAAGRQPSLPAQAGGLIDRLGELSDEQLRTELFGLAGALPATVETR